MALALVLVTWALVNNLVFIPLYLLVHLYLCLVWFISVFLAWEVTYSYVLRGIVLYASVVELFYRKEDRIV